MTIKDEFELMQLISMVSFGIIPGLIYVNVIQCDVVIDVVERNRVAKEKSLVDELMVAPPPPPHCSSSASCTSSSGCSNQNNSSANAAGEGETHRWIIEFNLLLTTADSSGRDAGFFKNIQKFDIWLLFI